MENAGIERVRVAVAALNFYPVYAGPAIRFARYLPQLTARGLDMSVLAGTPEMIKAAASGLEPNWADAKQGDILPTGDLEGIPVTYVRLPDDGKRRREILFGRAIVNLWLSAAQRPDVLQLLSCGRETMPLLVRTRRMGIRTVFTATMLPDEKARGWLRRQALRRAIAWPMKLVDVVVVSSDIMRERLQKLGVRTAIHVIPNGVDTYRFQPPPDGRPQELRCSLSIGPDDRVLLFLGPIIARKGVDLLLEAWTRLAVEWPRLHLVLAGPRLDMTHPANESFHRRISTLISQNSPERVHFTGMVRNPESYMQAADVFVFPSRREGMPNAVPEAMASGLPIVMTPFVGLPPEFGEEGREYLLADFEPDALAARIGQLLSDQALCESLGARAREWVEEHLDVDRSVQRYAELYRQLAADGIRG